MAYVSRSEGGYGTGVSVIHNDSAQHSVLVPDAELLLSGSYHRAGPDLVLTGHDGQHHIIPGYFSSEHPPALVAPNGMSLSGATVELLAGSPTPGHYAQAQSAAPADGAIGKVEKSVGDVTVIRNGVSVTLNVGDAVYKSDVIQTGVASSVGISFPDGTALNLIANTKMALNDYSYTPSSNANDALFTLVEGTFAFVAGKVAHTGDMKITTPVATMGIRGTTGMVEQEIATINATQNGVTYSFFLSTDFGTGTAGLYDLTDAQGNVIATVSQTGYVTYLTPQGPGAQPLVSVQPITGSQYAVEQEILQQLFQTLNPLNAPNGNNSNGSSSPPPPQAPAQPPIDNSAPPPNIHATDPGPGIGGPGTTTTVTIGSTGPTPIVYFINPNGGSWDSASYWSDGYVATSYSIVEILIPVTVIVTGAESANALVLGAGAVLEIGSGASVLVNNEIIGAGTIELYASGSDPELIINGKVLLTGSESSDGKTILPGGTILLAGSPSSDDLIVGVASTVAPAVLTNFNFTIMGAGQIGTGDGNLTLINDSGGVIDATGLLVLDTGNNVANAGMMEATTGGTLQLVDSVANTGTVEATGTGALVEMASTALDNAGTVLATSQGTITLTGVSFTNEVNATVEAMAGGTVTFNGGSLTNSSLVEAINGGTLQLIDSDSVSNNGTVEATGTGALVEMASTALDNAGTVLAMLQGTITFTGVTFTNEAHATVEAALAGTVTFNGGTLVNSSVVEAIDGGTLQIENVTVQNSTGSVSVDSTSTLDLVNADIAGGIVNNAGNVFVTGGASQIDGVTVTNSGTVTVETGASLTLEASTSLTNQTGGVIDAAGGSITINLDNAADGNFGTIEAGGGTVTINDNTTTDINDGAIYAFNNGSVTLNLNAGNSSNHGLIEATTGGTVTIEGGGGGGNGGGGNGGGGNYGTIEAANGGQINFNTGGLDNYNLIEAAAGGTVDVNGNARNHTGATMVSTGAGAEINFSGGNLDNSSQIVAGNGGAISLSSVLLTNEVGATFESTGTGSTIAYNTGGVTNDGTIEADTAGAITFNGSIGIQNEGGTIEALSGGTITFETTGTGSVSNDGGTILASGTGSSITFDSSLNGAQNDAGGVIEAANGGTIVIDGFEGGNGLSNLGGVIQAIGAGAKVELASATIMNGTLETDGVGVIEAESGTSTFVSVTLAGGNFQVDGGAVLDLEGGSSGVAAYIDGTVTFQGDGIFRLDVPSYSIMGGVANGTLVNQSTIEGQGRIGSGDSPNPGLLTLVNSGTIEALGGQLVINTGTRNSATTTNTGILEANGAAAVLLLSFTNLLGTGGTIAAYNGSDAISATASVVELLDVNLVGGTLATTNFGTIETVTNNGAATVSSFDGVTNDGYVYVTDNTTLILRDTITNTSGTIALGFGGNATLEIDGTVALNGGTVQLSAAGDKITALTGGATLDNASTIEGAGTIGAGDGELTLNNETGGSIDANLNGKTLTVDTGNTDTNAGTMEATNGGTLVLDDSVNNSGTIEAIGGTITIDDSTISNSGQIGAVTGGAGDANAGTLTITDSTVHNAGGEILAVGSGSVVHIAGSTIDGGELLTDAHGLIEIAGGNGPTIFDGSGGSEGLHGAAVSSDGSSDGPLTVDGHVSVDPYATLDLVGNIVNNGDIDLTQVLPGADPAGATLQISNTVSLDGTGTITLLGSETSITSATDSAQLDNGSTIQGAGEIGDSAMTLVNKGDGVIDANNAHGFSLVLDTGSNTITNGGTLEASGAGYLDIKSGVDNHGGTLLASGGTIEAESCVSGGSGTIAGGTLQFDAAASVNVTFNNGDSGHDYGTLVLGDASQFSGQIDGFAGTAAGAANSDTVELANICETSWSVQSSNGNEPLTLNYGDDQSITLTFDGFSGTFVVEKSGGNTYIYDPPSQGSSGASSTNTSPTTTAAAGNPPPGPPATGTSHDGPPPSPPATGASHDVASGPSATGASTAFGMALGHDQLSPTANLSAVSTISPPAQGGVAATAGDSFVFQQVNTTSANHDTSTNQLTGQGGDHANASTELASLLTHDAVFDQVFDAAHNDGAAISAQFHQMVASAGHLH